MLRDNPDGLIEPMTGSAGTDALALCIGPHKSSDDRPKMPYKSPPRRGGTYTNGERRFSISR
jgi:hypothetical protein